MRLKRKSIIYTIILLLFVLIIGGCAKDEVQPNTGKKHEANSEQKVDTNKKTTTSQIETVPQKEKAEEPKPEKQPENKSATDQTAQHTTKKTTTTETEPTKKPTPPPVQDTVTVTITGYQGKTILSATKVGINQGASVLDVTKNILKKKGIPISVKGSGSTAYVEGINNVWEFDHGPTSGWKVFVNGKEISQSAGVVKVAKNNQIFWKYMTDVNG